jgi:hypothetical protein
MRRLALIALAAVVCGGIGTAIGIAFPGRSNPAPVAAEPSSLIDNVTAEPTPTPSPSPSPTPSPEATSHFTPRRLPAPTATPRRTLAPAPVVTPCDEENVDVDCPTERPRPRETDTPEPSDSLEP